MTEVTTVAWRRLRDPGVPVLLFDQPVMPERVVVAARRKRQTRAEIANDRIEQEQAAVAEGQRVAERLEAEARQEWEAGRPREPVGLDRRRFVF